MHILIISEPQYKGVGKVKVKKDYFLSLDVCSIWNVAIWAKYAYFQDYFQVIFKIINMLVYTNS